MFTTLTSLIDVVLERPAFSELHDQEGLRISAEVNVTDNVLVMDATKILGLVGQHFGGKPKMQRLQRVLLAIAGLNPDYGAETASGTKWAKRAIRDSGLTDEDLGSDDASSSLTLSCSSDRVEKRGSYMHRMSAGCVDGGRDVLDHFPARVLDLGLRSTNSRPYDTKSSTTRRGRSSIAPTTC